MKDSRRVLVVEDDEDDFFLTQRELRKFVGTPILHVENGQRAIEYLAGIGSYVDRSNFPFPDLMFLDLKMNHVNGLDVLHWVGDHLPQCTLKIFVLTGSNEPRDRELVRISGAAAGYIVKPLTAVHLGEIFGSAAEGSR